MLSDSRCQPIVPWPSGPSSTSGSMIVSSPSAETRCGVPQLPANFMFDQISSCEGEPNTLSYHPTSTLPFRYETSEARIDRPAPMVRAFS